MLASILWYGAGVLDNAKIADAPGDAPVYAIVDFKEPIKIDKKWLLSAFSKEGFLASAAIEKTWKPNVSCRWWFRLKGRKQIAHSDLKPWIVSWFDALVMPFNFIVHFLLDWIAIAFTALHPVSASCVGYRIEVPFGWLAAVNVDALRSVSRLFWIGNAL